MSGRRCVGLPLHFLRLYSGSMSCDRVLSVYAVRKTGVSSDELLVSCLIGFLESHP